jgi:adenylate cyclase class IV
MSEETKLSEFIEWETKYRVEAHLLVVFKKIVSELPDIKRFLYVEGPDHYFTHPNFDENSFGRYRKPSFGLDGGRSEWTVKVKPKGAKNNIQRTEVNWRVDKTKEEDIFKMLELQGYKFNFSIVKNCHVMFFDDANVVFYTVYDTTEGTSSTKVDHFVEIEVNEEKIRKEGLTEDQAWNIISKYEKILAPVGVTPQKRLRKSLWEMYRR